MNNTVITGRFIAGLFVFLVGLAMMVVSRMVRDEQWDGAMKQKKVVPEDGDYLLFYWLGGFVLMVVGLMIGAE